MQHVNQINFRGLSDVAAHVDTSGTTYNRTTILNRYSAWQDEQNVWIRNFDNINQALTYNYTPASTAAGYVQYFAWSLDETTGNVAERGAYDRFYWTGDIVEHKTSGDAYFTWSTVTDTTSSYDTDGMLIVPQPGLNLTTSYQSLCADQNQTSFRIRMRYESLSAFEWVPLFTYSISHQGSSTQGTNLGTPVYKSEFEHWGPRVPPAISHDDNNLMNEDRDRNARGCGNSDTFPSQPHATANGMMTFMYCHDGNGNGMLATCAGELPVRYDFEANPDTCRWANYPRNKFYARKNGLFSWQPPHNLTATHESYMHPTTGSLQSLWRKYGGDGFAREDGAQDWRSTFREHTMYSRMDIEASRRPAAHVTGQGVLAATSRNSNYAGRNYGPFWLEVSYHSNGATIGRPWTNANGDQSWDDRSDYIVMGGYGSSCVSTTDTANGYTRPYNWGPMVRQNGQIVAYGAVDNADMSDMVDIHINVNRVIRDGAAIGRGGIITDPTFTGSWGSTYGCNNRGSAQYSRDTCQLFFSGKILNFTFRDTPGPTYSGRTGSNFHRYYNGYGQRANFSTGTLDTGLSPDALIIRPTVTGDCRVHDVSFGHYNHTGYLSGYPTYTTPSYLNNYQRPNANLTLTFPKSGVTYSPVKNARNNPSLVVDQNGNTPSANHWIDVDNLFDYDSSTLTTAQGSGESGAIYIPMNVSDTGSPADTDPVGAVNVSIRNVRQLSLTEYILNIAIVENDKTTEIWSTTVAAPVNSSVSTPADSSQALIFNIDPTGVTYGDIKDAWIKMWVTVAS